MNKFKKVSIIALLLLIIGLVGAIATNSEQNRQLPVQEIEIKDPNYKQIELLTYDAKVELLPTNRAHAYIEVSGHKTNKKLSVSVQDSLLFIKYDNKQFKLFNFNIFPKTEAIKLFVPAKQYEQIKVSKHDGTLLIEQLEAEQLVITGRDGLIRLKNTVAAQTTIKGNDGILELEEAAGAINADMKDAIIKMHTAKLQFPISLAARDGLIQLTVVDEPENAFISTSIQDGLVSLFGERNSSMLYGNGETKVNLKLNDGKITIKRQ